MCSSADGGGSGADVGCSAIDVGSSGAMFGVVLLVVG